MNHWELIYGTGNPAKVASMKKAVSTLDIGIIGAMEMGLVLPEVDESGNTPLENAIIKANAYFNVFGRPVFACDSGLYIEGLPNAEQPGIHVRVVQGKRLDDEAMIAYYSALAGRLGGKAVARYINAICLVMDANTSYEYFGEGISGDPFYMVEKPHPKRVKGFPLDCLSAHIPSGRYCYDSVRPDGDVGIAEPGFRRFFYEALRQYRYLNTRAGDPYAIMGVPNRFGKV